MKHYKTNKCLGFVCKTKITSGFKLPYFSSVPFNLLQKEKTKREFKYSLKLFFCLGLFLMFFNYTPITSQFQSRSLTCLVRGHFQDDLLYFVSTASSIETPGSSVKGLGAGCRWLPLPIFSTNPLDPFLPVRHLHLH